MNYSLYNDLNRKKLKSYNPNNFTPLDAIIVFALFLVSYHLLSNTFGYLLNALYTIGVERGIKFLQSYYFYASLSTVILGGLLVGITLIFCKVRNVSLFNGGGLVCRRQMTNDFLMVALLAIGMLTVVSYVNNILSEYFTILEILFGIPQYSVENSGFDLTNESFAVFYVLVATAVIPAFSEEFIFRGVIMRGLKDYGKIPAVVISSLLFALAHCNVHQFAYQFLLGLLIGFIVFETRNLWCGIFMHFCNNFLIVLLEVLTSNTESYTNLGNEIIGMAISQIFQVLLGVICLVIAIIYYGKRFLQSNKKGVVNAKAVEYLNYNIKDISTGEERSEKWYTDLSVCNDNERIVLEDGRLIKVNKGKNKVVCGILLGVLVVIGFTLEILSWLCII